MLSVAVKAFEFSRGSTTDSRLPVPTVFSSGSNISLGFDSTNGVENPNFRTQIAKGADASTAYTRSAVLIESTSIGHCSAVKPYDASYPYRIETEERFLAVGQPQTFLTSDTATQQTALARLKRKLQSRIGSAKLMAPMVEVRELHGLIRQTLNLSGDLLQALIRAKRTGGRSLGHFASDLWLGYNFGMSPLLRDIGAAGHAVADYLARNDFEERFTASASVAGHFTYKPGTSYTPGAFAASTEAKGSIATTLGYRYVGAFSCPLRSGEDYTLLEHFGLSFDQIPATLWELTAFSWMADYFTNIGDYLSDVFTGSPGTTRYLVLDRRYVGTFNHTFRNFWLKSNPNRMIQITSTPSVAAGRVIQFQRTPLLALPKASLYLKTQAQVGNYAPSKLLNLLAILAKQ